MACKSKDQSNSSYDWHYDLHFCRDWSTVSPLAACCCGESSLSPLTGGAGKSVPAAQQHATPCTCGGTSSLYYGWLSLSEPAMCHREDRAVSPAQFLYFCRPIAPPAATPPTNNNRVSRDNVRALEISRPSLYFPPPADRTASSKLSPSLNNS